MAKKKGKKQDVVVKATNPKKKSVKPGKPTPVGISVPVFDQDIATELLDKNTFIERAIERIQENPSGKELDDLLPDIKYDDLYRLFNDHVWAVY